jgi:hypothetical protein
VSLQVGDDVEPVVLRVGHRGHQIEDMIGRRCEGVTVRYSYHRPGLMGLLLGSLRVLCAEALDAVTDSTRELPTLTTTTRSPINSSGTK